MKKVVKNSGLIGLIFLSGCTWNQRGDEFDLVVENASFAKGYDVNIIKTENKALLFIGNYQRIDTKNKYSEGFLYCEDFAGDGKFDFCCNIDSDKMPKDLKSLKLEDIDNIYRKAIEKYIKR